MENNFLADKPVLNKNEDRFQRFDFSKRIAQSIVNRDKNDSIVIGIYGAWGEGKTSVLNFIESEISESNEILIIKFNPWRYTDEDTLLKNFLKKISSELDRELKSRLEKAGNFVEKFGSIGGVFNLDLSNIGKVLSEVDLEVLKERVDGFLKESNKKLVIFIDDIDRLDKQEIYSIFRLVKLTGDFTNTTYILSFDEDMVAAAIGDRFGEGSKEAGINFLEKIIQLPLKIPKAQSSALKKYCFELIDKSLEVSEMSLSDNEQMRFVKEFTDNVLLRLTTPRLAVRYGNSLSFALPLLKGEVNIVDLMLIESIKIFYPGYYDFIKNNSDFFINPYSDPNSYSDKEDKKKDIKEHLTNLGKKLSKKDNIAIKDLLIEMFPLLRSAYENYSYSESSYEKWYKDKRIVSQKYFNRYFSYSVLEGDISDISFEEFINNLQNTSIDDIINILKNLISQSSSDKLIQKLRNVEDSLDWNSSRKLILAICKSSDMFNNISVSLFSSYTSAQAQSAIFIYKIISKHKNKDEQFSFAKELMLTATDINYAYELNNWFRYGDTADEKLFTTEQYHEIFKSLLQRALEESGGTPIFEKYIDNVRAVVYLLNTWAIVDRSGLNQYITSVLDTQPEKSLILVKSITPTFSSSHKLEPYKASFRNEEYQFFKNSLNAEYIYEAINKAYGDELNKEDVFWGDFDIEQTDINILRQFIFWYKQDRQELEETTVSS